MSDHEWVEEFPGAIVTCNPEGIILHMNEAAVKAFEKQGGRSLIGSSVLDCHPAPARGKLEAMMDGRKTNVYTIEKNGKKKLIYQTPWYKDGAYAGFMEIALEIPVEMPHFVRSS